MARPAKYDRDEMLDSATSLFWERGYRGVSVKDLVNETGVLPGSIYSGFGNKEGVYIECIHHYSRKAALFYEGAEKVGSPLGQIERLFENLLEDALSEEGHRGCFVLNAMLDIAPQNEKVSDVVQYYVSWSENWIRERLEMAKAEGELKPDADSQELAECLFAIVYGIRAKARSKESDERILRYERRVYDSLMEPWRV